ncbi:MAG: MBOAT family protein [Lachnospiraceae bacterium]|nr:MBOAT family protein [Lachnospiraceae bacterium]
MVFSSITFLFYYLPAVMILYLAVPWRMKNIILLFASLIFYAWGEPVYVLLMVFSCVVNYVWAILLERGKNQGLSDGLLKTHFILNVIFNLSILFYFKYINMFLSGLGLIVGSDLTIRGLSLPIGISFYTFQTLSYTADVYRGKVRAQRNLFDFSLYISMFPQLIAGPIVRYADIEKQLRRRRLSPAIFGQGAEFFITGLAKKVLLANALGEVFSQICALGNISWLSAWLGAVLYSLQLYFDFSGYSDMAIGLGYMLGFKFNKNFDHPYVSASITEFWRRWHISLSGWFREYVYIPLGGNRAGKSRHILNLLIVWMLTGLWHGAGLNFLFWGLYYAVFLIAEKYILKDYLSAHRILGHIYTLLVVVFGWVIFAFTDSGELFSYIGSMFFLHGFMDSAGFYYVRTALPTLIIAVICCLPQVYAVKRVLIRRAPVVIYVVNILLFILCVACIVYDSYNPFLYFRF